MHATQGYQLTHGKENDDIEGKRVVGLHHKLTAFNRSDVDGNDERFLRWLDEQRDAHAELNKHVDDIAEEQQQLVPGVLKEQHTLQLKGKGRINVNKCATYFLLHTRWL